jgi:hypothetical protein
MTEEDTQLAIKLFCLAEDFNRAEYCDEAFEMKMLFQEFLKNLDTKEIKEVTEYLKSIGA